MASTLIVMGIVIAILGKIAAVIVLMRSEQARMLPFGALIFSGYLMVIGGGLAGGSVAGI